MEDAYLIVISPCKEGNVSFSFLINKNAFYQIWLQMLQLFWIRILNVVCYFHLKNVCIQHNQRMLWSILI